MSASVFSTIFYQLFLLHRSEYANVSVANATTTSLPNLTAVPDQSYATEPKRNDSTLDCRGVYGCFPLDYPWESSERPVALRPAELQDIRPFYYVFSAVHPQGYVLDMHDASLFAKLNITKNSYIVMITHGFADSVERTWGMDMAKSLVDNYEKGLQVFTLDWRNGARPPYAQAVANTRVLGAYAGRLLELILKLTNQTASSIHLVGHSLGAQMFGYAGKYLLKEGLTIGRITGLDPAGPYFRGTPSEVRLDESDAYLVDILHTDSTSIIPSVPFSLGSSDLAGHFDFFPNGGLKQSNCKKSAQEHMLSQMDVTEGFLELVSCSHETSHRYFFTSIDKRCNYVAVECSSWEEYKRGNCWGCLNNRCFLMGMNLRRVFPPNLKSEDVNSSINEIVTSGEKGIKLYLATTKNESTCGDQLRFTIVTSSSVEGGDFVRFSLIIRGANHVITTTNSEDAATYIKQGTQVSWIDVVPETLGKIHGVVFQYHEEEGYFKNIFRWSTSKIYLKEINIEKLLHPEILTFHFCEEGILAGETKLLKPNKNCVEN